MKMMQVKYYHEIDSINIHINEQKISTNFF